MPLNIPRGSPTGPLQEASIAKPGGEELDQLVDPVDDSATPIPKEITGRTRIPMVRTVEHGEPSSRRFENGVEPPPPKAAAHIGDRAHPIEVCEKPYPIDQDHSPGTDLSMALYLTQPKVGEPQTIHLGLQPEQHTLPRFMGRQNQAERGIPLPEAEERREEKRLIRLPGRSCDQGGSCLGQKGGQRQRAEVGPSGALPGGIDRRVS